MQARRALGVQGQKACRRLLILMFFPLKSLYSKHQSLEHRNTWHHKKLRITKKIVYCTPLQERERRCYKFPIERLFCLYFQLDDCGGAPTAELYSLVSSLVSLKLIDRSGGDDLDDPTYSCSLNIERVERLVNSPEELIIFKNYLYYSYFWTICLKASKDHSKLCKFSIESCVRLMLLVWK